MTKILKYKQVKHAKYTKPTNFPITTTTESHQFTVILYECHQIDCNKS